MAQAQTKDIRIVKFMIGIVIVLLVLILFAVFPIGAYMLPVEDIGGGDGGPGDADLYVSEVQLSSEAPNVGSVYIIRAWIVNSGPDASTVFNFSLCWEQSLCYNPALPSIPAGTDLAISFPLSFQNEGVHTITASVSASNDNNPFNDNFNIQFSVYQNPVFQKTLDMFDQSCVREVNYDRRSCSNVCQGLGKTCLLAFETSPNGEDGIWQCSREFTPNGTLYSQCICCSPP